MPSVLLCVGDYEVFRLGLWDGLIQHWEAQGVEVRLAQISRVGGRTAVVSLDAKRQPTGEPALAPSLVIGDYHGDQSAHLARWAARRGVPLLQRNARTAIADMPELAAPHLGLPLPPMAGPHRPTALPLPPIYSPAEWGMPNALYEPVGSERYGTVGRRREQLEFHGAAWAAQATWEMQTGRGVRAYHLPDLERALAPQTAADLLLALYRYATAEELLAHRGLTAALWRAMRADYILPAYSRRLGIAALAVARGEGDRTDLPTWAASRLANVTQWLTTHRESVPMWLAKALRVTDPSPDEFQAYPHGVIGLAEVLVELRVPALGDPLGDTPVVATIRQSLTWAVAAQYRSPAEVVREMLRQRLTPAVSRHEFFIQLQRFVGAHPPRSAAMLEEWLVLVRETRLLSTLSAIVLGAMEWPTFPPPMLEALHRYHALGGREQLAKHWGLRQQFPIHAAHAPLVADAMQRCPGADHLRRVLGRCERPALQSTTLQRAETLMREYVPPRRP